jgi:hypothetical protein
MQRGTTSPIRHIVLLKVERALPLISPVYDQGLSEEEVHQRWRQYWNELQSSKREGLLDA